MPRKDKVKRNTWQREYGARPEVVAARRAYYLANREAILEKNKAYRAANIEKVRESQARRNALDREDPAKTAKKKERWREWHLRHRARNQARIRVRRGLPLPTRDEPVVCECCGDVPTERGLALDHCHETKAFRGWLCNACNLGIGKLGDTIAGVELALAYLQRAAE